jgi:hypothetical protein
VSRKKTWLSGQDSTAARVTGRAERRQEALGSAGSTLPVGRSSRIFVQCGSSAAAQEAGRVAESGRNSYQF